LEAEEITIREGAGRLSRFCMDPHKDAQPPPTGILLAAGGENRYRTRVEANKGKGEMP
jgi:hypothetical protein